MILHRLAESIRAQNWFTVLIEVLVVVLGIFIGLQVDGWNELRKERALERRYLERLGEEISQDIDEMRYAIDLAESRRQMGQLLFEALENPRIAERNPTAFITAIEQAGYTFLPAINDATFEEIKFAGHLGIIQNEKLRRSVTAYYKLIERYHQWGYLRENIQVEYSNAAVGILTPDQLSKIAPVQRYSDPERVHEPWEFAASDALQALEKMRAKQAFVDQIPRGTSKSIEIANISAWLHTAESLHRDIASELE